MDRALSGATIPGQSGPGSNGNEGVLGIPPKLQHHWSLTIRLFRVICRTLIGVGVLALSKDAVGVFYNLSRLGKTQIELFLLCCFFLMFSTKSELNLASRGNVLCKKMLLVCLTV